MIHELITDQRVILFDGVSGVVSIPGEHIAELSAKEAFQLLTWLQDNHRDALYRISRGVMPARDNPLCPWCRTPGTYTVRKNQTEVSLEYNSYQCADKHIFDVKRGEA
jgi:hypothetical protein